jgi:hypothetical protein
MAEPSTQADAPRLGLSGRLARAFQANPLTPILALTGLLLGLVAVLITPREEEPQIDVPWRTCSCRSRARRRAMSSNW